MYKDKGERKRAGKTKEICKRANDDKRTKRSIVDTKGEKEERFDESFSIDLLYVCPLLKACPSSRPSVPPKDHFQSHRLPRELLGLEGSVRRREDDPGAADDVEDIDVVRGVPGPREEDKDALVCEEMLSVRDKECGC